jgi:hypothetical protein
MRAAAGCGYSRPAPRNAPPRFRFTRYVKREKAGVVGEPLTLTCLPYVAAALREVPELPNRDSGCFTS